MMTKPINIRFLEENVRRQKLFFTLLLLLALLQNKRLQKLGCSLVKSEKCSQVSFTPIVQNLSLSLNP